MEPKKPYFAAILITLLLASAIAPAQTQTSKFKVLHTFRGAPNDGAAPWGVLIRDGDGSFYGTTTSGGSGRGFCTNYSGCGTAFKFDKAGTKTWLHSFAFPEGWSPEAGLLRDKRGNLYGTTDAGGDTACYYDSDGCGTLFKLDTTGKETVLHKFTGDPDGWGPGEQPMVEDASSNLYGTTVSGGKYGFGSIFRIDKAGDETVLYSFTCYSDGCGPNGVILDASGNLYGVAFDGGVAFGNSGYGVVFELDRSGNLTVLHTFESGADGANPDSALVFGSTGNLYGTTQNGGSGECGGTGCGTIFELSPKDGNWSETVLYSFCSLSGCTDGERPLFGPLVIDNSGNIYGTTYFGGKAEDGVVFKLDNSRHETVLHSFTGGKDGAYPVTGMIRDNAGNLYGTAVGGGDPNCQPKYGGCGTLFKIAP
jgi:uncharacterized repeat protein (TIGR03803 family)